MKINGMINIKELIIKISIAETLSDICFENLRCSGENKNDISAAMQIVPKYGWKKRNATTTAISAITVQFG